MGAWPHYRISPATGPKLETLRTSVTQVIHPCKPAPTRKGPWEDPRGKQEDGAWSERMLPRPTVRAKWTRNPHQARESIQCVWRMGSPVSPRLCGQGQRAMPGRAVREGRCPEAWLSIPQGERQETCCIRHGKTMLSNWGSTSW